MEKCLVFTDESSFSVFGPPQRVWIEEKKHVPIRQTVKFSPKILVWGGISWAGKTPLVRITDGERLNARGYQEIISKSTSTLKAMWPKSNRWNFQQDGAPCHTAKSTMDFFKKKGIRVLRGWPPQSPDLNPIENVWGMIKNRLYVKNIRSSDQLWQAVKREWDNITLLQIRSLIASVKTRLKKVQEANGSHTSY